MKVQPSALAGSPEPNSDPIYQATASRMGSGIVGNEDLARLIQKQTDVMELLLKEGREQATLHGALSRDMLDILKKMHDKQVAADISFKPIPPATATSSSGWTPLLRAHLAHIQPTVDRWRGTLDTLLVFIALFSAIVTTFFVQSLTGLSQDTGMRTNELLQNLTNIYIAVNSAGDASQLNVSPPVPFEPESSAVRLNFYWSISLILSISVAALAVTSRGYVAMLTRSDHRAAHKKLGDIHRRWAQAERLLAPAIDLLPQLLIIPVLLFVVGLLDNIISIAIPPSRVFLPVFVAGLLSCAFALVVAIYTGWTVIDGCIHPETSPFQSTLSRLLVIFGTGFHQAVMPAYSAFMKCFRLLKRVLLSLLTGSYTQSNQSCNSVEAGLLPIVSFGRKEMDDAPLAAHEIHAYHSVIQQTHEDDIVDQAAAVLWTIFRQREWKTCISPEELSSLCYMLSDEASIRTNITTAQYLVYLQQSASLDLTSKQCAVLLNFLVKSAQRYSLLLSGQGYDATLWKCPFTYALLAVVRPVAGGYGWYNFEDVPIVLLLLYGPSVDTYEKVVSQGLPSDWDTTVIPFLLSVMRAKLMDSDSSSPRKPLSYLSMLQFMDSNYSHLRHSFERHGHRIPVILNSILMMGLLDQYQDMTCLESLTHWAIEWYRNLHVSTFNLHKFVANSASHVLHRLSADWGSRLLEPMLIQYRIGWLSFLWDTTNSVFARESRTGPLSKVEESMDFLRLCVDGVLLFQEYDVDPTLDASDSYGYFPHMIEINVRKCIPLCKFHATITRSVQLIRERHPSLRLDSDSWTRIITALGKTSSEYRGTGTGPLQWTPEFHREGIKRSVLELLRTISPETAVTTADTNDTASDMAIPWAWLENSENLVSGVETEDRLEH